MSLFSRLLLGFLLAVVATICAQAIFMAADPEARLAPRLLLVRGQLVHEQGESALIAWKRDGKASAIERLHALDETGLEAWLVNSTDAVGERPIPADVLRAARGNLNGRRGASSLGVWTRRLADGKTVLAVAVPKIPRFNQLLRLSLLIVIPVLVCFGLSKWLSAPIARLRRASVGLGQGDLNARVGKIAGYREATQLASTFDAMAGRMQGMIESQSRMLADVSHEIRSPLARIRLAAEMARRGNVDTNLDRITRDVGRLDELVEAVATLVKTGQESVTFEPTDLSGIVKEVVEGFEPSMEKEHQRIDLIAEPTEIVGDRRILHGAVENLIRNSLAYSGEGTEIEVRLTASPPYLVVRDHGPGVPAEDLERIFEPFYRVSTARDRNTGGSGLGLAIVARAAQLHGGKAIARNHPGGGLEVSITFGEVP